MADKFIHKRFSDININNQFFDSLKRDYTRSETSTEFTKWFAKKAAEEKEDLLAWADEVLKPTAELAWDGKREFSCGPWCRFCKAKNICRKRAEENLKLSQYEFRLPPSPRQSKTPDSTRMRRSCSALPPCRSSSEKPVQ